MWKLKKSLSRVLLAASLVAGTATISAIAVVAPASASTCTEPLGNNCGPYTDSNIPMSNGYNTYVANQNVGAEPGTTESLNATDASNWSVTTNAVPAGYGGVQVFPDTQQLTNDWCGTGWGGCQSPTNTPLASLSALKVSYSITAPTDSDSDYEFAPDVWTNYADDVMFWADTHGRCNTGSYGSTVLGTATFDGQTWTVNRYGGPGAEIIFVLDSDPNTPDSCAQQTSGTIDVGAGLQWLNNNGYISSPVTISQLNSGYEITSTDNQTFSLSNYSITATVGSGGGGESPVVTTTAPTGVSSSGATLDGTVNPEGESTTYKFDYGTTTGYGSSTTAQSAGSGSSAENESAAISGLAANTTYHYRIEATNSTGTSYGNDEQFTTNSVGQVTEGDTTGTGAQNTTSVSWTESVGTASDRALLVDATVGINGDGSCVTSVTDGSTPLTNITTVHTDSQNDGYLSLWELANPPSGNNDLTVSVSGCAPRELIGYTEEFAGVNQTTPFGTPASATGYSGTASVGLSTASSKDMVGAFVSDGSGGEVVSSPFASKFVKDVDTYTGAGNSAGASAAATGSSMTAQWSLTNDYWAALAVEALHD